MKEDGQVLLRLFIKCCTGPSNEFIHIIGHPKGVRKYSDAGVVIPQSH